jgi:hypothetical protein
MTYDCGGVPLTPEMNSFKAKIGSHQCLMARRDPKNSAVVPDSRRDRTPSGNTPAANASDQQFFGIRQSAPP